MMLPNRLQLAAFVALTTASFSQAEEWAPVVEPGASYEDTAPATSNRGLLDLLNQIESLQREVRALRGEIEEQGHRLQQLEKREQDLYGDLDRRLQAMESTGATPSAGVGAGGAASPVSPAGLPTATPPETAGYAPAEVPGAAATIPGVDTELAPTGPEAEKQAYQQAFGLLKAGQYDNAIASFVGFLSQYPNSAYADKAQYWVGEAYYVTRKFDPAIMEYSKLIQAYPDSPKRPHALLKIAYSYDELGQKGEAKAKLQELITSYPGSTAARLAEERLQRMVIR